MATGKPSQGPADLEARFGPHRVVPLIIRCACHRQTMLRVLCSPRAADGIIPLLFSGWCQFCGAELEGVMTVGGQP